MQKIGSILDYSYPGISPDIWLSDGTLNPVHKDFVLKLLNSFYNSYGLKSPEQWVIDVTVIGSLTTNRYIRTSDFDCHVIVNIDKFIETNMPKASKEEAITYLDNARKTWDRAKILMPFGEHVLELYIEDPNLNPSNTEHVGRYSMFQNKWLKDPIYFAQDLDFEESRKEAIEGAKVLANELDDSFGEIGRQIQRIDELKEVLQAWPEDKRQLYYAKVQNKLDIIEEQLEKSIQIKQDLVDQRHLKQDAFSENEIQFKFLARFHYFSILQNLKTLMEQTGGQVTTQELPLIEKIISQGSLGSAGQYWFDPNGKFYQVDLPAHNHTEWIQQNTGMNNLYEAIEKGWIRARKDGDQAGIHLMSLANIPDFIYDFILKLNAEITFIEDINDTNYIKLFKEDITELGVQKAVNKALSQKRMGSLKEAGSVLDINGTKFYKNPSKNQIYSLLKKLEYPHIRFIIDPMTRDLYAFSGYSFTHTEGMRALGIPPTGFNYQNFTGDIKDLGDIDFAFEQRNKKVAFVKQAGQVMRFQDMGGNEIRVVKDPTPEQAVNLFNNSHSKQLRYILDDSGLYIWDAYFAEHVEIGEELGLDSSSINRMGFINSERDALKWTGALNQTASIKEAFLKEAFEKETDNQIAIDFDGTIAKDKKFPDIGEPEEGVKEALSKLKEMGYDILIYSCRSRDEEGLELIREYLDKHKIPYDSIFEGDKPFAKFYIDNRAIHFDNWDNVLEQVEKTEKKASLAIVAGLPTTFWIAPDSQVYPAEHTHDDWVYKNTELIKQKYNIDLKQKFGDDFENDPYSVVQYLINNGWVRVASAGNGRDYVVELNSVRQIPTYAIDILLGGIADDAIVVFENEELTESVQVSKEELARGQNAINRAIRTQIGASLNKKALGSPSAWIMDPNGKLYPAINNDHQETIDALAKKGIKFSFANGWSTVRQIGNNVAFAVGKLNSIPQAVQNYLDDHTFNNVEIIPEDANLEGLSQPPTIRHKDVAFGRLQKEVNRNIMMQRRMKDNTASKKWASLDKEAAYNHAYWIAPDNKVFEVREGIGHETSPKSTHSTWIRDNLELLKNQYGLEPVKTQWGSDLSTADLLAQGWTRIGDGYSADWGITVKDINNIPTSVDSLLAQFAPDGSIITIEDMNWQNNVTFDWPVKSVQQAVNQALMRRNEKEPAVLQQAAKLFSKRDIIAKTKKVKQGDYSCLMALVPHDLAQEIVEWGVRNVPDKDLYLDEEGKLGRELESHITIKYGLLTNDAKHVRRSFNDEKPFKAKLGKVKHFQPPELPFDVLTVEIISEDLERANEKICDSFECATGLVSDEYHPHITIAYMKRDTAKEHIGADIFDGKEVELDTVIFSPHKGNRTYFSISNDKESSFILEQINKTASGDYFLPSFCEQPANNEWQFEHGGDDEEIALQPDSVSDETTWYAPCTEGKPRSKDVWRQFISIFKNPFSKNEEMTVDSAYDPELEEANKDALGEDETALDYSKGFYDPKKHDFPHNTTWDSLTQDGEPSKPTSVTYSPQISNEDNLDQNSPGGFPRRFMGKPKGEWFSDEGEVVPALQNMWKYRTAALEKGGYFISPEGEIIKMDDETGHAGYIADQYGNSSSPEEMEKKLQEMLVNGWTRVREGDYEVSFEVADILNIPSHVEGFLMSYSEDTIVIIDDIKKNHVTLDMGDLSFGLQKAVNIALSQKRMGFSKKDLQKIAITRQYALYVGGRLAIRTLTRQKAIKICQERFPEDFAKGDYKIVEEAYTVAFLKQAGGVIDVNGHRVWKNPSLLQTENLLKNSRETSLRALIDPITADLYVWNAWDMEHQPVIHYLGIEAGYEENFIYIWNLFSDQDIDYLYAEVDKIKSQKKMAKQASIEEIDGLTIFVNPTEQELMGFSRNLKGGRMFRGLLDPKTGDLFVWDAYEAIHTYVIQKLGLHVKYSDDSPFCLYFNPSPLSISEMLERQQEVKQGKIPRSSSLKQAGDQSASVPDYLINEWKTDQIHDDVDSEPYVNHDQRDYPYGMHDSPENTGYNIGWPKDNQPYVVRLDQLDNPSYRNNPFNMTEYWVTYYDSMPMSDSIEATNPD